MRRSLDALVLPAFDDLAGLPSERTPWHRSYSLDETFDHPGLSAPLACGDGIGVVPTGVGKAAAATTVSTLCAIPDLDLSDAVVLSVGVAGGPPRRTTIGDVVIADTIIDWDDKLRLDPDGTPTLQTNPYSETGGVYDLDNTLAEYAHDIAAETPLERFEGMSGETAADPQTAVAAQTEDARGPTVRVGTNCCADELWHGDGVAAAVDTLCRNRSDSPYLVTEMEDAGTALALKRYGMLDSYVCVRGVANPDRDALSDGPQAFDESFEAGFNVAVTNATMVGRQIVDEQIV